MRNEAIPIDLSLTLYTELCSALRRSNDTRHPEELVALAIRTYHANHLSKPRVRGYQWKALFLPEGTDLRMRYMGTWYYAKVEGDALMYAGESMSPREWTLLVTGSIRNAWRDIWIRRCVTEGWTRALMWREQYCRKSPHEERRSLTRRASD